MASSRRFLQATLAAFAFLTSQVAAATSLRHDGVIVHNGLPLFVSGFYGVNSPSDVAAIADAGFNAAEVRFDLSDNDQSGFESILDAASERNVAAIVATSSENVVSSGVLERWKNKSCVMGWDIEDDADDVAYRTFEQVRDKAVAVKNADPDHLTYLSCTAWSEQRRAQAADWCSLVDAPAAQSYPITPISGYSMDGDNALEDSYLRNKHYAEAAGPQKAFIANLQSFAWWDGGRYPTPQEERNMTYTALIAGARGILYYQFQGLTEQTQLWEEMCRLAAEITLLAPVLIEGERSLPATGNAHAVAASWVHGDELYLIAANISYSTAADVTIALPAEWRKQPAALFDSRPSGLILSGDVLTGEIAPGDVHAYRIAGLSVHIKPRSINRAQPEGVRTMHGSRMNLLGRKFLKTNLPGSDGVGIKTIGTVPQKESP